MRAGPLPPVQWLRRWLPPAVIALVVAGWCGPRPATAAGAATALPYPETTPAAADVDPSQGAFHCPRPPLSLAALRAMACQHNPTLVQAGTYFYHSHFPMQEAFGMVGFFIIHPIEAWQPVVDRDFCLLFQNFFIPPNSTIPDSMAMDWNWHTINGRSGPYTTPLVCRHGERVRIRILDFSPMQHHPVHIHGHTFWLTGAGGGRIPPEAWIPANITLTSVAQARVFEFVANNPGDWLMHCHMVHHMMNHMVRQVGPRIRDYQDAADFMASPTERPPVQMTTHVDQRFNVPGYPQKMQGMEMSDMAMKKIWGRREVRGMRHNWFMGVHGLMTVVRVLPDDLFDRVMHGDEPVEKGSIFDEIVRRQKGSPETA